MNKTELRPGDKVMCVFMPDYFKHKLELLKIYTVRATPIMVDYNEGPYFKKSIRWIDVAEAKNYCFYPECFVKINVD